jgi:hypothetical protein
MSENVNIKIGADYFRRCSRNEYSQSIPTIWIREAIQNSIDARSSRIDITLDETYVSVEDDGTGMTADIILNKLLVLGGTFKENVNSTGGFGKAKEVLFFCWDEWEIQSCPTSKDYFYVCSDMVGCKPINHVTGLFSRGTKIKIKYDPSSDSTWKWSGDIKDFIRTCSTKCQIYLNGEKLDTLPLKGKKYEYPSFKLLVNKSSPEDRVFIRINGICMFTRYVSTKIPAAVCVDLSGSSVEMLNSSRESLKYSYQREIDKIIEEILVNPRSLLTKSSKVFIDKYLKRELENLKNEILETCDTLTGELANMTISAFIAGQKTDLENCISELKEVAPHLADKLQTIVNNEYESELGYSFVVHRHGKRVPSIDPTSKKAKKILHMWKTIIDELMLIYYPGYEYITGLDFDPSLNASYTKGCDLGTGIGIKDHICINPVNVISLKTAEMGTYMFFRACHEITHIQREYHNENFLIEFQSMLNQLAMNPKKWYSLFMKAENESKQILKAGVD